MTLVQMMEVHPGTQVQTIVDLLPTVGDSGTSVNAATQTEVTSEAGTNPTTPEGNAYEVLNQQPESSNSGVNDHINSNWYFLIGGLLAVGFFKDSIFGFLK